MKHPADNLRLRTKILIAMAFLITTLIATSTSWSQAIPQVVDLGQLTFEHAEVEIRLTSSNTGIVIAKCVGCNAEVNTVTLSLDEDSRAFLNHREVLFSEAVNITTGIQAVIYDPYAMRLVKLSIVNNL